ncbi:MAG: hypothetical protein ACFCVH_21410 [Alphaproteobacteria bacterium]
MATGNEDRGPDPMAAVDEAKQRAMAGMDELRDEARERADELGVGIGNHADNVARAIRTAGDSLRGKEDWLADAADGLSHNLERLSTAAREKGFEGIKRDAEQLARERPVLFIGAAVAVGVALGRLLRASTPESTVRGDPPRYRAASGGESETADVSTPPTGPGWPGAQPADTSEQASTETRGGRDGAA